MTEFWALNNYAWATGEGLQEKVDLTMPNSVLDMRFAHYMGDFADNEGILQATYQAALQVEKKKALKQAREQTRGQMGGTSGSARTEERKKEAGKGEMGKHPRRNEKTRKKEEPSNRPSPYGQPGRWATKHKALKGVPMKEHKEYFKNHNGCWRCGQMGH